MREDERKALRYALRLWRTVTPTPLGRHPHEDLERREFHRFVVDELRDRRSRDNPSRIG